MIDPTLTKSEPEPQYTVEPDGFDWSGDFHYIEDICPDLDEATKQRVWNRIMSAIEDGQGA